MKDQTKTVSIVTALPKIAHRKRVAAYARVSSGKDAMLHSLSAQISYYSAYIQRNPLWEFVGIYVDEATTGTKNSRKEFQKMLEDCRSGKIDLIITKSVTRFARNTLLTLETIRELKCLSIDVFFERENIHSVSHDGELMLTILASFAQEESRSVSENCKWRIRRMFQEGRPNTGRMLGYRLIDGRLYIIPDEAVIVQRIFSDYLSGMGKQRIAKFLNRAAIIPMNGKCWQENTIRGILNNEKYTGDMILQKTYRENHISKKILINRGELPKYFIKDSHEAIISREMFEAVQKEIARRATMYPSLTHQPKPKSYPFTGLIRCMLCGRHYKRKHTAAGTKYEKIVWICHTFDSLGKQACESQQIPENILLAKSAEVLSLPAFDESIFAKKVAKIQVVGHGKLRFVFKDETSIDTTWQNPSRRESWTKAMKQAAREQAYKQHQERQRALQIQPSSMTLIVTETITIKE